MGMMINQWILIGLQPFTMEKQDVFVVSKQTLKTLVQSCDILVGVLEHFFQKCPEYMG